MANAGDYNRKVVFKAPTITQNNQGGEKTTYEDQITTWAKIKRTNQFRALEAGSAALIDSDTLIVRNSLDREAINKDWLVNYDNKDHVIHSINSENKTEIVFIVKAKDPITVES